MARRVFTVSDQAALVASVAAIVVTAAVACRVLVESREAPPAERVERLLADFREAGMLVEDGPAAATMDLRPEPRLFQIKLPAGDVGSINVGWYANGVKRYDPRSWLDVDADGDGVKDYDGVEFVGAGMDRTHVRCTSNDWCTVSVIRHRGIVQLRDLTVHAGQSRASNFGQQNLERVLVPGFEIRLINTRWVTDPPSAYPYTDAQGVYHPEGHRPYWLVFGYNCDVYARGCVFDGGEGVEHDAYLHGFAGSGALFEDCDFVSAGAECFKERGPAIETAWAGPDTEITLRRCKFWKWYRDHSFRGGAAIVIQGGASKVRAQQCLFFSPPASATVAANARSHCVMISSEGESYDGRTGAIGSGFGNEFVLVEDCAMVGHSDFDWNNSIMSVYRAGGAQQPARGVLVQRCGIWGEKMLVQVGGLPVGRLLIRGCNTPAIAESCRSVGMDTSVEATFPTSSRRVPLSEGMSR